MSDDRMMAGLPRGKRLVLQSLANQQAFKASRLRRVSPEKDAAYWCDAGLDKDGFKKAYVSGSVGYGVFATKAFKQGDFLLEYVGNRLDSKQAEEMYSFYERKQMRHYYIYHFKYLGKEYCIDATETQGRLCQFVNDSPINEANSVMKLKVYNDYPRLCLFANREISEGEEIRYDYGESHLKWRQKKESNKASASPADLDENPFDLPFENLEVGFKDTTYIEENPFQVPLDTFVAQDSSVSEDGTGIDDNALQALPEVHVAEQNNEASEHLMGDESLLGVVQSVNKPIKCDGEADVNTTHSPGVDVNTDDDADDTEAEDDANDSGGVQTSDNGDVDDDADEEADDNTNVESHGVAYDNVTLRRDEEDGEADVNTTHSPGVDINTDDDADDTEAEDDANDSGGVQTSDNGDVDDDADEEADDSTNVESHGVAYDNVTLRQDEEDGEVDVNTTHSPGVDINTDDDADDTEAEDDANDSGGVQTSDNGDVDDDADEEADDSTNVESHGVAYDNVTLRRDEEDGEADVNTTHSPGVDINTDDDADDTEAEDDANDSGGVQTSDNGDVDDDADEEADDNTNVESHGVAYDNVTLRRDEEGIKDPCGTENSCDSVTSVASTIYPNFNNFVDDKAKHTDSVCDNASNVVKSPEFVCWICEKKFKKKGGLTTHTKIHFKVKGNYKKPNRTCPFCHVKHSRLPRHLQLKHGDIPEVTEALLLPKSSEERKLAFAKFRKVGILNNNKLQASKEHPKYEAERAPDKDADLVCCSKCKGFYLRRTFHRHKERCTGDSTFPPNSLHIDVIKDGDNFAEDILSRFRQNEIGDICRKDKTIILIGRRLYQRNLRRVDKTMETRKCVMQDMRLLARLYLEFVQLCPSSSSAEDMFIRTNFDYLETAIHKVTKVELKLKYGVKNAIFYLLNSAVEIIVSHHLSRGNDDKAKEIEHFLRLLKLNKDIIFGDAAFAINLARQQSLRMPEQQASESEVAKLNFHTQLVIEENSSEFTMVGKHEFVQLRDSVCARLTLFNARRGGEPSRLKLSHLTDAMNKRWINSSDVEKLEEWEQSLFKDLLIAYQAGKGNHLVPVLIPRDLIKPLNIIADETVRHNAGVLPTNCYLFPSTENSVNHIHGWHAINRLCNEANVRNPQLMTASKQRHRVSTMYCMLQVPEEERQYFYKHMGHSKEVNLGTYQYPLPIMEITKVGKHLLDMDNGCSMTGSTSCTPMPCTAQDTSPDMSGESDCQRTCISDRPERSAHSVTNSYSEESDNVRKRSGRGYFRWNAEDTSTVLNDFREWIQKPFGNCLPGCSELRQYLGTSSLRCSYIQLRTKIMNEQNKCRARKRKREAEWDD